jgi:hypothetical protein
MTRPTAYDALGLPANMGAVEILEDPAVQQQASNPTRFQDIAYSKSDDCHLGLSNQVAGGVTILNGASLVVAGVPTSPFKPKAMTIPSYLQIGLFIKQVNIGPFNAVEGDPVPAAAHSEVSLTQFVSYPTIQANSPMKVELLNVSGADKTNVAIDVRGIRLRE